MGDSRFKSMFEDAEFKRDRDAPEFKGTGRIGNDAESEGLCVTESTGMTYKVW